VREEQQLIGIDRLALFAVSLSEELFELVLKPGDELILLTERLGQLVDLAVCRVEVGGECGVAWCHTLYYGDV
jgi:hypothetical protein